MYCPKCGFNLNDDNGVEVCPECGAKLRESTEKKEERAEAKTKKSGMKYAVAAAAAVAVLCGCLLYTSFCPEGNTLSLKR